MSTRNITKEVITHLDVAPIPEPGKLLEVRTGKLSTLGQEKSGIFKKPWETPVFCTRTGLIGDERAYPPHRGTQSALHQYCSSHYVDWRKENSPKPHLFDFGAFGENLVGTNMSEENVCIGDLYRIGKEVIVQVSEPRSPCYKLNIRFEWPRALKRIQRTGRVGWNYRVLREGYIQKGDAIVLIERPNPIWSIINVKRVIQGRSAPLALIHEVSELEALTQLPRDLARQRIEKALKNYTLVKSDMVTPRVKHLTFELNESITIQHARFPQYAFAQIEFGSDPTFARSYSIVSGDQNRLTLGIALDDNSRGGSRYMHEQLKVGDSIRIATGISPEFIEQEAKFADEGSIKNRVVIIGGIGVTAFLPVIEEWEAKGLPYEIHYAVRSPEEAAFLDDLPGSKTTVYAKSRNERLNVDAIIPIPTTPGVYNTRIFCCGPARLMDACKERTEELGYPAHFLHSESFNIATGGRMGEPFDVEVNDHDSGRQAHLTVPSDKSLLSILQDAGFDMTFFCQSGGCGACKVSLCDGKVDHVGTALYEKEKKVAMLSCVDRGRGSIKIELD